MVSIQKKPNLAYSSQSVSDAKSIFLSDWDTVLFSEPQATAPSHSSIPSIAPCTLTPEEGENLIRDFMRDNNVILFLKEEFEENELDNCNGKIVGTNVPQGSVMTTGDTLVFVISRFTDNS